MKINKIFNYIGIIILIALTIYTCNSLISKKLEQKSNEDLKPYFEEQNALKDVLGSIDKIKNRLPIDIGGGIYLNEVEFIKDKRLVKYIYKSEELNLNELTSVDISNFRQEWKQNTLLTMKDNPENLSFVNAEINFDYILFDKENKEILRFNINSSEYK